MYFRLINNYFLKMKQNKNLIPSLITDENLIVITNKQCLQLKELHLCKS
jgi:hypothetical protein